MQLKFKRQRAMLLAALTCALPHFALSQDYRSSANATTNPETVGFSEKKLAHIKARMQSYVDERKLAGLSTLLARKGRIVHFEQYGLQDLERQTPMQANTIFRLASMTKPITSVAVMMLIEQGKLRLDDPVEKYLPAFALTKVYSVEGKFAPLARSITIQDLLMHTSGLTAAKFGNTPVHRQYREAELGKAASLKELVSRLATLPLLHQPGTAWSYGLSPDVLSRIVEIVTGVPFEQFVEQKILQPLQMRDSGFYLPEEKRIRLAAAYTTANGNGLQRACHKPLPARQFGHGLNRDGLLAVRANALEPRRVGRRACAQA